MARPTRIHVALVAALATGCGAGQDGGAAFADDGGLDSFGSSGGGGVDTGAGNQEDRGQNSTAKCKKTVHVHIANWASADALDDPASSIAPNGCWSFDMAHEIGHYWAHCKGASNKGTKYPNTWVVNWGSPATWQGGPKMWVYNETRQSHSPPDSDRIDNCFAHLSSHWGVTPARAYEYMTYEGTTGWTKSGNAHVRRSFAELYGPGTWWPHWNQWKQHKVGRPMAQIVDVQNGGNTHTVVRGMCEYVTSDNWIGLWIPGSAGTLSRDTPAYKKIIAALNECTGGTTNGGNQPSTTGGSGDPSGGGTSGGGTSGGGSAGDGGGGSSGGGGECSDGVRECLDDWTYRQCDSGTWSGPWSCTSFASTTCDQSSGYCTTPSCGTMFQNTWLSRGDSLFSCDGRFELTMQNDGNLVLYELSSGSPLWASNTGGTDGQTAIMQTDGNFLVKDSGWNTLWNAGTWGHPGAYVVMQNDGNVVVYETPQYQDPLWASNTGGH